MKPLALTLAVFGLVAFTGAAYAGAGCAGSHSPDKTAETPPPHPIPSPST